VSIYYKKRFYRHAAALIPIAHILITVVKRLSLIGCCRPIIRGIITIRLYRAIAVELEEAAVILFIRNGIR
jgi:hypothetical protein